MGERTLIYLAKPGGQRQGPYTLEEIQQDLAAQTYEDSEYWAWSEGMPGWVPLYELPGIAEEEGVAAVLGTEIVAGMPSPEASAPGVAAAAVRVAAPAAAPEPEAGQAPNPPQPEPDSGMPFAALVRIFLFTSGDGPAAWHAPEVMRMLEAMVGVDIGTIRLDVPRDIIGQCAPGELLKQDGALSEAAWRMVGTYQPGLIQQAREQLLRVCVRTFRIGAGTVAALVLFYNKQKV
jgi:GYF domain 2